MSVDKVIQSGEVHRYHFCLQKSLKDEIALIGCKYGLDLQDTIVLMLKTVYPAIVKYHFTGQEAKGKPERINWDAKTHIKLDLNFFKRIRLLRTQMNVFSVAIIVRRMLMLFLKYYRRGGIKLVKGVMRRFERVHFRSNKKVRIYDKRKLQTQLSAISSKIARYIVSFNHDFQLITIKTIQ